LLRTKDKQAAEARKWQERNQRVREWLLTHPRRVPDNELRRAAINYTEVAEAELIREMKNSRSAKRLPLRDRLKYLVMLILAQRT
jgi:hypothetical protein